MPRELLTPAEMALADAAAAAQGHGVAGLMLAAGRAVMRTALRHFRPARTLVLCGPGNNGGDGYVAARLLAQQGWPVAVAAYAPPRGVAAAMADSWRGPCVAFDPAEAARADLVIDAVLGAGLDRDLDPAVAAVLGAARTILAVDVPSGLDGATGQPRGAVSPAARTVTFFRRKPGHLLLPGRALCGKLTLAQIGLPDAVLADIRPQTFHNGPALWTVPQPGADDHKYRRGHVTVLGGPTMAGAARLAAAAGARAGAGLVTIAGPLDIYQAGAVGLLVDPRPLDAQLADQRRSVWVCGPGLGSQAAAALAVLLPSGRLVVVDADGLTACAGRADLLAGAAVLTPHEGEFARVFGPIGADRLAAVRQAAARTGAVVLLKGADTVVAHPDGRAAINDNAPPWLATAGAGDVLAGLIAGLLAQGMAPFDAACAGAWLHGQAASLAGPGLLAEDLPGLIPRAAALSRAARMPGYADLMEDPA